MNMPKVYNLKNNLTVVIDNFNYVETVSAGLFVNVGSRIEQKSNNGICHFLEHMIFKGTNKRNMYQISEDIESKGGIINAWTSKDKTAFYVKVIKEEAILAVDIICDIVHNSIFPIEEIEKEKKVVIEEIKQSLDDPDDILYNYYQSICYDNNSLGLPILGIVDSVNNITQLDLKNHVNNYYTNNNKVFVVAGNVNPDIILKALEKNTPSTIDDKLITFSPAVHSNNKGTFIKENLVQAHIILSYPVATLLCSSYFSYLLISTILGRGMSSRLFKEIREKRGLVYSIYSFLNCYKDVGSLAIQASCSSNNIHEVISLVKQEITNLIKKPIDNLELNKAKIQLVSGLHMMLESSYNRIERWATNIFNFNYLISPKESSKKIFQITKEDILQAAYHLIKQDPVIAVLNSKNVNLF